MIDALIYAIVATFAVSLISLFGIFALFLQKKMMGNIVKVLIAFAAGALIGNAFLDLIPEAVEANGANTFILVIVGFVIFYFIEKALYWRHCHEGKCEVHTFTYLSLIGDTIHNFGDGIIIVASFLTNFSLGVTTTIAVMLHEIPQEIGDFAVLLYGGFSRTKAVAWNFISALFAIGGAIAGFFIEQAWAGFAAYVIPVAAGGFIYIGAVDLIPELKEDISIRHSILNLIVFVLGLGMMFAVTLLE